MMDTSFAHRMKESHPNIDVNLFFGRQPGIGSFQNFVRTGNTYVFFERKKSRDSAIRNSKLRLENVKIFRSAFESTYLHYLRS